MINQEDITTLPAVATDADSAVVQIAGAKRVTVEITTTALNGNTVITPKGSIDGTNYVDLNKIVANVVNTNAQTLARAATHTITGDGVSLFSLDFEYDIFQFIKFGVNITTAGSHIIKVVKGD